MQIFYTFSLSHLKLYFKVRPTKLKILLILIALGYSKLILRHNLKLLIKAFTYLRIELEQQLPMLIPCRYEVSKHIRTLLHKKTKSPYLNLYNSYINARMNYH